MKLFYSNYKLFVFVFIYSIQSCFAIDDLQTQRMQANGVQFTENANAHYTTYQLSLIETYNFDVYRNYSTTRIIQIEDGPKLELESLVYMQSIGRAVDNQLLLEKSNRVDDNLPHSVITLINIGFKYSPPKHTETGF